MNVVSIAQNVPGPVVIARLVTAGATAIKIEPPWGDLLEGMCKSWYDELHAGVQVERIDLKTASGMQALFALIGSADIFLASQRPAALEGLGLDAASLTTHFPTLRHLNIVGDTADPQEPGHDLTYQAKAGILQNGMPLTLLADLLGAERAHAAVMELMHDAPGGHRVVGLLDSLHTLTAPLRHGLTAPGGPLGGGNPAYAVYPAKDGAVAVGAVEPHFRARLYGALELADGQSLSAVVATKTAAEWERWGAEHDLPIAAIRTGIQRRPASS